MFLIDIGLPGMNGYEVARALRKMAGGDRLRLIALTGFGRADGLDGAREAGFDSHLTKPADLEELERLLTRSGCGG